jgi:hypothetical protein
MYRRLRLIALGELRSQGLLSSAFSPGTPFLPVNSRHIAWSNSMLTSILILIRSTRESPRSCFHQEPGLKRTL